MTLGDTVLFEACVGLLAEPLAPSVGKVEKPELGAVTDAVGKDAGV